MSQKAYRRLTRCLFVFLFLVFFLLYLLLSHRYDRAGPARGGGWRDRRLTLDTVPVSEVRSGGFIVDEFPFPASTGPEEADFGSNLVVCRAQVKNEGEVAVNVNVSIHGTDLKDGSPPPQGLHGCFYHYGGEDPLGEGYSAFLSAPGVTVLPFAEKHMILYLDDQSYPRPIRLEPGEEHTLSLFFWVDRDQVPTLTDLDRQAYSVTVKLTSRAV